jgi:hypothetical protein
MFRKATASGNICRGSVQQPACHFHETTIQDVQRCMSNDFTSAGGTLRGRFGASEPRRDTSAVGNFQMAACAYMKSCRRVGGCPGTPPGTPLRARYL